MHGAPSLHHRLATCCLVSPSWLVTRLCRARWGTEGSLTGVQARGLSAWCDKGRDGGAGQGESPTGVGEPSDGRARPQDVARLIVERSTIMSHLFSKRSCSAESDTVLAALLSIFSRYVRRMRKSKEGEEVYSWVRRAEPRPPPGPRPRVLWWPFTLSSPAV